jgi:PIN domain nuclease of toxin-antitoxin system
VKYLLDTHVLLWAAGQPEKLPEKTRSLLIMSESELFFSVAALWEIVIKRGLGRDDFKVDPDRLRIMLARHGYTELAISADHVLKVQTLPSIHKDPFDRLLIAQAMVEGMQLLTADAAILLYGVPAVNVSDMSA